MEITSFNSTHDELAEATRGYWGKDVLKDCTLVYCGQIVFGVAKDTATLDKNAKCPHYDWNLIGSGCWMAVIK
ncbi:MAG: hypothetical protein IKS71_00640 [Bacteroidales bacterium]|nr:hypothetical protein [Bacteroidales bacterium]